MGMRVRKIPTLSSARRANAVQIIAIDGGEEKEKLTKDLGAEHFIDFQKTKDLAAEVQKLTTYGAHGCVVFSAVRSGYELGPHTLRPGGTMVAVGLPADGTVLAGASPIMLAMKRLNIVGSVTGTLKDVEEALDFTARGLVHVSIQHAMVDRQSTDFSQPILTKGSLHDVDKFCELMAAGKLPGRAVLRVAA